KEKRVTAFFDADGTTPKWSRVTAQAPDVVFSHAAHVAKDVKCADCHGAVAESTAVSAALFIDMDACTKCHETKKAKTDCAACHRAAAKSEAAGKGPWFAPANHDAAWRTSHGAVAGLATPRIRAERCDDCHGKAQFPESASCAVCHAATKPASHDAAWRG